MTGIDELSPDRRAVLSLILRRGRTYAEIATALQIDEDTVREHAHSALEEIAGEAADGLNEAEREQIGDYLLAQQGATERLVTYDELEGSAAARAFAGAVASELAPLAANPLPEIPGHVDGAARPTRGSARAGLRTQAPREPGAAGEDTGGGARRGPAVGSRAAGGRRRAARGAAASASRAGPARCSP